MFSTMQVSDFSYINLCTFWTIYLHVYVPVKILNIKRFSKKPFMLTKAER